MFILAFSTETESNTQTKDIATFKDFQTAQKEFKKAIKTAYRGRQASEDEFKERLVESIVVKEWIDGIYEGTVLQQIIYLEGIIDRMNYKGENAINYYTKATFNGKELMYTMYFQGKKEKHKVPGSKIKQWHFR